MTSSRLRLAASLMAAILLTGIAVGGMLGASELGAYVGAGLLCCAAPLAVLSAWRLARRAPVEAELAPGPPAGQMLNVGAWIGIATGGVIWLLAAASLDFPAEGGFWVLGALGVMVGYGMAGVVLWSMAHPFPAIRADDAGLTVGDAPPIPWRDIEGVRYRRTPFSFPRVEIRLEDGETLRHRVPVTLGIEDLARFFAVAGLRGVRPRAGGPAARRGRAAGAGSPG